MKMSPKLQKFIAVLAENAQYDNSRKDRVKLYLNVLRQDFNAQEIDLAIKTLKSNGVIRKSGLMFGPSTILPIDYPSSPTLTSTPSRHYTEPIYLLELDKKKLKTLESQLSGSQSVQDIYYNRASGTGYVGKKQFKFKNHQPEYRVFAELYTNINKEISREKVLALMGFKESEDLGEQNSADGKKLIIKVSATYEINELAKKIRKRAGLSRNELVMNNGALTLIGNKVKTSPKTTPNRP